ncbi:MAG: hypothetical protein FRX48_03177 [Lasallia pustulata]|uniref:Asl1-like glycosyl hydrolase catalytic domain-containing protein n=1 Tax=Lasallia pustulata TaxID=136370 RepID=A0A5M8PWH0_9LECA|nr:MAG: hypothetical protein FRX48_03177 [Lasallia pustulata]
MARLNIALLISALPAALAFPKHWGVGHAVIHDRGAAYKHRTSTSIAPYVSSSSSTLVASSTSTSVVSSPTALSSTSVAPSSSSSAASTPSSYAANTKRGLAYNTASLTSAFTSAPISWAYNWGDSTSGLPSEFEFVPMLWGLDDHTIGWITTADAAVSSGTGYLLGFNEPDIIVAWGGSGISTADAVTGWNTYMQPFAGGATKLGSPGVSNAPAPQGLGWLAQFVEECSGCQIDFLVIHWYCGSGDAVDSAIADFQGHVGQAITQANGKPVWITEFRYIGPGDESDFINQVLPWLDANTGVERYSYFMASSGNLLTGTGLSATGEAYVTAA